MADTVPGRAERAAKAAVAPGKPRKELGQRDSPILRAMTGRAAPMHILMAELIVGAVIVGIRAVADYEVKTTGTIEGTIGHPKGQFGPFPIMIGLMGTFFLLSLLAVGASGGKARAKVAVAAGALVDLALAMKSIAEIEKVAATFGGNFGVVGTAKPSPTVLVTNKPVGATAPASSSGGSGSSSGSGGEQKGTAGGVAGCDGLTFFGWCIGTYKTGSS